MLVELALFSDAGRGALANDNGEAEKASRRRRARARSTIFMALALLVPHQLDQTTWSVPLAPRVTTTINRINAIPPSEAYDGLIREASALYHVEASLIRSVIQAESGFNPSAVSPAGARGLMQLTPIIAASLGVENPFDPRENIMGGTRLLRELLDRHHGNLEMAIASYNAGPTAVALYGAVPPFKETQGYVKRVTGLIADARSASDN